VFQKATAQLFGIEVLEKNFLEVEVDGLHGVTPLQPDG
jgi:hypothetical protein